MREQNKYAAGWKGKYKLAKFFPLQLCIKDSGARTQYQRAFAIVSYFSNNFFLRIDDSRVPKKIQYLTSRSGTELKNGQNFGKFRFGTTPLCQSSRELYRPLPYSVFNKRFYLKIFQPPFSFTLTTIRLLFML